MISIKGTSAANNTSKVLVEKVKLELKDDGTYGGSGDYGVAVVSGQSGFIKVIDCQINDGKYGIYSVSAQNVSFVRNILGHPKETGIASTACINVSIASNTFNDVFYMGIYVNQASGSISEIVNNQINVVDDSNNTVTIIGIALQNSNFVSLNNNQVKCNTSRSGFIFRGISTAVLSNSSITGNNISVNISSTGGASAIRLGTTTDCTIGLNVIKMDNDNVTANHYGVEMVDADRNIVSSNDINLVNNNAKDIGILLDASSDNNQGGDNITYNVGTSVSDLGVGNAVTAKDV